LRPLSSLRLVDALPISAMVALIIVGVWKSFGINMVLFAAGLAGIPKHYYEAASIDGANGWQHFWHITVPLLAPTTLFVLVISIRSEEHTSELQSRENLV